jgi:hypothetical protein
MTLGAVDVQVGPVGEVDEEGYGAVVAVAELPESPTEALSDEVKAMGKSVTLKLGDVPAPLLDEHGRYVLSIGPGRALYNAECTERLLPDAEGGTDLILPYTTPTGTTFKLFGTSVVRSQVKLDFQRETSPAPGRPC